ncbi:MAG: hypothetical protein EBU96_11875 [Actinobacteria bacterium]|nr:hypothetical protein [Actinomycetota bacterium]
MRNIVRTISKRQLYEMPSGRKAYVLRCSYKNQEVLMTYLGSTELERQEGSMYMSPKNVHRCCKYMGEVEFRDGDVHEADD